MSCGWKMSERLSVFNFPHLNLTTFSPAKQSLFINSTIFTFKRYEIKILKYISRIYFEILEKRILKIRQCKNNDKRNI